ncbi:MAG TPA: prefoldin subunit beta [Candidatus Thermoplasmatota archaeon]|nr:prefoldin subunit beta [Candidatus Thermoplasmatota archaeon]
MAEPGIPVQLQKMVAEFQQMQQQFQQVASQRAQLEMLKSEGEEALKALETLPAEAPVYRNIGSLLVREARDEAVARLKEDQETLEIRLNRLGKQESALREGLQSAQQKIQASLPRA